jgi:hypothetical protein
MAQGRQRGLQALQAVEQLFGNRRAPAAHAHQHEAREARVALGDLTGDPGQAPTEGGRIEEHAHGRLPSTLSAAGVQERARRGPTARAGRDRGIS